MGGWTELNKVFGTIKYQKSSYALKQAIEKKKWKNINKYNSFILSAYDLSITYIFH